MSATQQNLTLSVIMPALNEEKNIKEAIISTLNAYKKYKIKGNIIVINDGVKIIQKELLRKLQQRIIW